MGRRAKIFVNGRSQAVRLPKEFRFDPDEVGIRKEGDEVIVEPLKEDWAWLDDIERPVDEDSLEAAAERPLDQERPDLDVFE